MSNSADFIWIADALPKEVPWFGVTPVKPTISNRLVVTQNSKSMPSHSILKEEAISSVL